MKRSTWRSRRSRSTDATLRLLASALKKPHVTAVGSVAVILAAASCQMQQKPASRADDPTLGSAAGEPAVIGQDAATAASPDAEGQKSAGSIFSSAPAKERVVAAYVAAAGGTPKLPRDPLAPPPPAARRLALELVDPPCDAAARATAPLTVRLRLASPVGTHVATVRLAPTRAGELATVEIDGQRLSFAPAAATRDALLQPTCAALAANPEKTELDAEPRVLDLARDWATLVAPDCDLAPPAVHGLAGDDAWTCKLPAAEPEAARQELIGIRTTMIRRWSRQPYLLARRLAVGISLAQALQSKTQDHAMDTFCSVVKASLPVELPATIASKRWQAAFCGKGEKSTRVALGMFGLAKTVSEIDFMRQLFERTSKLGSLTVRIPESMAQAKQFLVSLKPEADVAENLTRETARLWSSDASSEATPLEQPKACWHPVYAEDAQLLRLARHLGIAGDGAAECERPTPGKESDEAIQRYFAESITSETEFVLPNGRSKTLRLPTGKYSYTLQALPENPEEWDDAAQLAPTAKGQIIWDVKRPRPVIASW